MHHDSNMEKVDSKMYGLSDGPMMRARTKQLQSALTSQMSATKVSMSLEAYNLNGNCSNMFVCFQIRLGLWFGSFGEFGFHVKIVC
jgi:hypothetical protein